MLACQIRSDLVETIHDGAVAVVDVSGKLLASHGDIDRPFFIRSAAKPFQAYISQSVGAGLEPQELAMACASHRGLPVQVALVRSVLSRGDIDESSLRCPRAWPISAEATRILQNGGEVEGKRIWHNCSGKHAGFLRACVANGWPTETYLEPTHPLQQRVVEYVSRLGGYAVEPVGVDGCGAPVLRTTTRALAHLYSRLASEPRLEEVRTVMHRYPALVGADGEGDTEMAIATNSVAKGGAAGCLGVAVDGRLGIGVKSWDGLGIVANLAAASALIQLGVPTSVGRSVLEPLVHPDVLGGGRPVGRFEPRFELAAG